MRIGVDASRAALPRRTGTEGYSWRLLRELPKFASPHDLTYYFNGYVDLADSPSRKKVLYRDIPFPRLWTQGRLAWEMVSRAPDLLFVPAHVLPWRLPRRSVVTICDLGYLYYPDAHPTLRRMYLHFGTLYSARAATLVIAISETTGQDLVNHYHISPKKIRVVHLAAGEEFHPSIPEEEIDALRQRYGLQKPYFLFVGSIHPRKNLGILLEAFTSVLSAYPGPISLVIAGQPGFKGQQIMHQAGDLPVQFLGYIPGPDLPMLMAGAVALVFPSLYEGFGLPALEAMASGIPVVAANVSSLPEIVGDAGLFADPRRPVEWAQAMLSLLTDEESRSRLIKRGLARAQQFSWQRCAQETMNVLVEALEK